MVFTAEDRYLCLLT